MEKALREAKRNTNWVDQNSDWEAAVAPLLPLAVRTTRVPGGLRAVRRAGWPSSGERPRSDSSR